MLILVIAAVFLVIRQLRTSHSRLREKVQAAQATNMELGVLNNQQVYEDPRIYDRMPAGPVFPPPNPGLAQRPPAH